MIHRSSDAAGVQWFCISVMMVGFFFIHMSANDTNLSTRGPREMEQAQHGLYYSAVRL